MQSTMSNNDPTRPRDSWFAPTLNNFPPVSDPWESVPEPSTRSTQQTEVMNDLDDSAGAPRDIGRRVGNDQRELFVSGGPVEAMQQQFDALRPEFIALHDIGCSVSRRLLASVARAANQHLQTLTIRRQGYGTPLATLEFIECSAPDSAAPPLRLYSTEVDTDPHSRQAMAQALLGRSRLGLIFVGDLAPQALAEAMQPLEHAVVDRGWLNRQLLLLPLGSGAALAHPAATLGGRSGISVRTAPQVSRPAEAWGYLSSTWNRLREQLGDEGRHLPALALVGQGQSAATTTSSAEMPTVPGALPMQPMPELPSHRVAPRGLQDSLGDYLQRLGRLQGMLGSCIFDGATSAPLAMEGAEEYDADILSREGHVLFDAMSQTAEAFGMVLGLPEMAITLEAYHLLLRPVPKHPELILLSLIDRQTNLTLIRLQVQRLDDSVD